MRSGLALIAVFPLFFFLFHYYVAGVKVHLQACTLTTFTQYVCNL